MLAGTKFKDLARSASPSLPPLLSRGVGHFETAVGKFCFMPQSSAVPQTLWNREKGKEKKFSNRKLKENHYTKQYRKTTRSRLARGNNRVDGEELEDGQKISDASIN
jgi:hypothetical protein